MDDCTHAPDKIFGVDISKICRKHDSDYDKGGIKADRLKADVKFYNNLKNKVGVIIAFIYFMGVRLFGWMHFKWE